METIKDIRKRQGVTVTAASNALGVTRPTYYRYEETPDSMPLGKYRALCDFLHIDAALFLPAAVNQIDRKEE